MALVNGTNGNDTIVPGNFNGAAIDLSGQDFIFGLGGNDTIDAGTSIDSVRGGNGDDTLDGGNDTVGDTLLGEDGNDVLRVRINDTLNGNAGDDRFRYENASAAFAATLDGGAGDDRLEGFGDITSLSLTNVERLTTSSTVRLTRAQLDAFTVLGAADATSVFLQLADSPSPLTLDAGRFDPATTLVAVLGTSGSDTILGPAAAAPSFRYGNVFEVTGTGDDDVTGGNGADDLNGEDGADRLDGREGDDTVRGGVGTDLIEGGPGNDTLSGNDGTDTVRGGLGNDRFTTDSFDGVADVLEGDPGDDVMGGGLLDTVRGGEGNDAISLRFGAASTIDGGNGTDTLLALLPTAPGSPIDLSTSTVTSVERLLTDAPTRLTVAQFNGFGIFGGLFPDPIGGAVFPEVQLILANAGGTIDLGTKIDPSVTSVSITGSDGADTVQFATTFTGTVRFTGNGTGTGSGNDRCEAGRGNDELSGQDGNDVLNGRSGNDTLRGGLGADNLTGGDGNDRFEVVAGDAIWTDPSIVALNRDMARSSDGKFDFTRIEGKLQNHDLYAGNAGTDTIVGTSGSDVLLRETSDAPSASVNLSQPRFRDIERFELGDGDDVLSVYGYPTNFIAQGGNGNDIIWAGFGNDTLEGGDGADYLVGGRGDDVLRGNLAGNVGDGDRDLYGFGDHVSAGTDRIEGFEDGVDRIRVVGFGITSVADPDISITQVGADVRVTLTDLNTATLVIAGFSAANLTNADFLFTA